MDFRRDIHEKAGIPVALVLLAVSIFRLAIIGRGSDDQVNRPIAKPAQSFQAVPDDEPAELGLEERPLRKDGWPPLSAGTAGTLLRFEHALRGPSCFHVRPPTSRGNRCSAPQV